MVSSQLIQNHGLQDHSQCDYINMWFWNFQREVELPFAFVTSRGRFSMGNTNFEVTIYRRWIAILEYFALVRLSTSFFGNSQSSIQLIP